MANDAYEVMDLKGLRSFWAMAKNGSLAQAGCELGLAEATVSHRIESLERHLATKLYEVDANGVRLTEAGERTMEKANSIFADLQRFEPNAAGADEHAQITLCTHDASLRYLLPAAVMQFSRAHPFAHLRLLARSVEDSIALVRDGGADIGIIPERGVPEDLIFERITAFRDYLIVPLGHSLAQRGRADFQSLLNEETVRRHPFIVSEMQLENPQLRDALTRLGLPFNVGLEVRTIDTLKHYVSLGLGVAAISGLCLTDDDTEEFEAIEIPTDISPETPFGIILRKDTERTAPLQTLIRMVKR